MLRAEGEIYVPIRFSVLAATPQDFGGVGNMHTPDIQQQPYEHRPLFAFDADGFLLDPNVWSQQMARMIAQMDDVGPLGPDHWSVIYYLREHHLTYGSLPPMSQLCRTAHLGEDAVHALFGGCRSAWRISGLPNPGAEALSYMS
jgi:TusE/DsrC/DsvC family sulfur relay protein